MVPENLALHKNYRKYSEPQSIGPLSTSLILSIFLSESG